jgi:hypothetical protein
MSKEQKLLASFIVNFKKGLKVGDPMEYARVCRELINAYGSAQDVSQKLGVGKETVRILSKISELPTEIQQLVSSRKIPLTVAFDLVPLGREKQIETANAVSGLSFKDARAVIRRVSEDPEKSASSVRAEVLGDLEKREINMAIIAIPKKMYEILQEESKDVPLLISHIVDNHLTKDRPIPFSYANQKQDSVSLTIKFPRKTFMALRRKTRNPANLVERMIVDWLKRKGKIE